jgi:hypothetical protein
MKDKWINEWVETLKSAQILRESLDEEKKEAWWW